MRCRREMTGSRWERGEPKSYLPDAMRISASKSHFNLSSVIWRSVDRNAVQSIAGAMGEVVLEGRTKVNACMSMLMKIQYRIGFLFGNNDTY